jgi:SAM-dependent methyltransferase
LQLQQQFGCRFVAANADRTFYDVESGSVSCVVCFEVLEHLQGDPMHLVSEVNRALSTGGEFYLTTPNVLSRENLFRFAFGDHPFSWSVYTHTYGDRHNREYTPFEIARVFEAGGFCAESIETVILTAKESKLKQVLGWVFCLLPAMLGIVPMKLRHAFIHARGRKVQAVRERYPRFLYDLFSADKVS